MEDYAGKTDRELLVEIYMTVKDNCGVLEDHEGRIGEVEKDSNQAKGALAVVGIGFTLLSAKVLGFLKLLGF